LGSHHLLMKLVKVFFNVTRDRVLIDQAECGLIW
jgi:hypothetical protein